MRWKIADAFTGSVLILLLIGTSASWVAPTARAADDVPQYQVLMPRLARAGASIEGIVVEKTTRGYAPARAGTKAVLEGRVIDVKPDGRIEIPPGDASGRDVMLPIEIMFDMAGRTVSQTFPQRVQYVQAPANMAPRIAQTSSIVGEGSVFRVRGEGLHRLTSGALEAAGGKRIDLGRSFGSELERVLLPPSEPEIDPGDYTFVGQDDKGNEHRSPTTTSRPEVTIDGPTIRRRGQKGKFKVTSSHDAWLALEGGPPQLTIPSRTAWARARQPVEFPFVAEQVGNYRVTTHPSEPTDIPTGMNAPRANVELETIQTQYDPQSNQTRVTAPFRVFQNENRGPARATADVVLSDGRQLHYGRVETEARGRGQLQQTVSGNVPSAALALHVLGIPGHLVARFDDCKCKKLTATVSVTMKVDKFSKLGVPFQLASGETKETYKEMLTAEVTVNLGGTVEWAGAPKQEVTLKRTIGLGIPTGLSAVLWRRAPDDKHPATWYGDQLDSASDQADKGFCAAPARPLKKRTVTFAFVNVNEGTEYQFSVIQTFDNGCPKHTKTFKISYNNKSKTWGIKEVE